MPTQATHVTMAPHTGLYWSQAVTKIGDSGKGPMAVLEVILLSVMGPRRLRAAHLDRCEKAWELMPSVSSENRWRTWEGCLEPAIECRTEDS